MCTWKVQSAKYKMESWSLDPPLIHNQLLCLGLLNLLSWKHPIFLLSIFIIQLHAERISCSLTGSVGQ